ncbi:MAG TPA: hypothetical protein VKP04_08695 [Ktedonobacteraceae bacterium]|nr:hypothetical protein [Ktedonobacteraceae bacterium]
MVSNWQSMAAPWIASSTPGQGVWPLMALIAPSHDCQFDTITYT